jgi:L-amino acid N-acyltransferase YncA
MPSWRIRDAGTGDASGIARVHVRAWKTAYRELLSDEVIRAHARGRSAFWGSYLERLPPREHVLVAVEENHVTGFASARPSPDDDAAPDQTEVGGLYVEPQAWERGIGSALLDAMVERLDADDFRSATLWVLAGNARARRFYEARGWILDGGERVDPKRAAREVRYRITLGS